MSVTAATLKILEEVLDGIPRPIALHTPELGQSEKNALNACIDSTWVSSTGSFLTRFENELARLSGVKHAVACVNATCALQVSLRLSRVEKGDEVLVPAISFIATANSVLHSQAIPHFVDVSPQNLAIDPVALETYLRKIAEKKSGKLWNKVTGRPISALVVVHCFGYPADLRGLLSLCERWGIPLLEDAAESLGSHYQGKPTGSFGKLSVLSFNGNKIITTGGGGAILTNDDGIAQRARHQMTTAKIPHPWEFEHDELGYNYRLPNLNAALGVAQLEKLPKLLSNKRALHQNYLKAFSGFKGARLLTDETGNESNHWLNTLILDSREDRDTLLRTAHENGFLLRPVWALLTEQTHLRASPKMDLPTASDLVHRVINLPSSGFLARA